MGIAAYRRGSAVISRQFCEAGGCVRCREVSPTPRPGDWGDKTYKAALTKAEGLLAWLRSRGEPAPTVEDLAYMVGVDQRWGRETCRRASRAALGEER